MIETQAKKMYEKIQDLVNKGVVGEEMTQHPMMGGTLMNFPNNYRGLAKVTRIRDEGAKNWMGVDMPIYVDMESGETNLLTPAGQMATVGDISKWFDYRK
jgi:hypothetical protein